MISTTLCMTTGSASQQDSWSTLSFCSDTWAFKLTVVVDWGRIRRPPSFNAVRPSHGSRPIVTATNGGEESGSR